MSTGMSMMFQTFLGIDPEEVKKMVASAAARANSLETEMRETAKRIETKLDYLIQLQNGPTNV